MTGIGRMTPFVAYSMPAGAVELCTIADPREEMLQKCAQYGGYIFHLLHRDESARILCNSLPDAARSACLLYSFRDEKLPEPQV